MQLEDVRLTVPIDFEILGVMSDGKRQTAPNLENYIDYRSKYIGDELRSLESYELVKRVNDSAMFVITDYGQRALEFRDLYSHGQNVLWGKLVRGDLDIHDARVDQLLPEDMELDELTQMTVDEFSSEQESS